MAYSQMAAELFRNLQSLTFEEWLPYDFNAVSTQGAVSLQTNSARGRRRNTAAQSSRMPTSRMPELEETDVNRLEVDRDQSRNRSKNIAPIEPAFLRDEDYPPGWLVFDPDLGVVSKVDADKHKQEHEQKQTAEPNQQPQHTINAATPPRQGPQGTPRNQSSSSHFKPSPSKTPTPARSLRATMPSTSPMHSPPTIAANG